MTTHPDNPMLTNGNEIAMELTDLLGIVELLEDAGIISTVKNTEAIQKKKEKVLEYMDYAVKRGTLIETLPTQNSEEPPKLKM